MTDTQRIKKDLPSLPEIGQAEDVARRLQEGLNALAGHAYSTVELSYSFGDDGIPGASWRISAFPDGPQGGIKSTRNRNPLEAIDDLFPDTATAIARKRDRINAELEEIRGELAEKEAEAEQLQRLEMEAKG